MSVSVLANQLISPYKSLTPIPKMIVVTIIGMVLVSCVTNRNTVAKNTTSPTLISEVTTRQASLTKKDVVNYFCSNLTTYFNTYKFYKISSETYPEREKQNLNSASTIAKQGSLYNVEYIGSAGRYTVMFSNKQFSESEQIHTFGRGTILGNAIRRKIYDTFTAWLKRVEINLKANGNSHLYSDEINAAVELENWYNSLNQP